LPTDPKKSLKIYYGAGCHGDSGQVNIIIAASSRKKAVAALMAHGIYETESNMALRWSTIPHPGTGPQVDSYARAFAAPETPFASSKFLGRDYEPVALPEPREKAAKKLVRKSAAGPSI
jgi:hypothetical protein